MLVLNYTLHGVYEKQDAESKLLMTLNFVYLIIL